MTTSARRPLPPELVSLVHHIQLHEAGWWDEALAQLVVAAIWLTDSELLNVQVADEIEKQFRVKVERQAVLDHVESLVNAGTLIYLAGGKLKIAETELRMLEKQAQSIAETEHQAKQLFTRLMEICPDLNADKTWTSFNENLLLPMICKIGARTYDLISGRTVDMERVTTLHEFLKTIPEASRELIKHVIERFLDPQNAVVRTYILGYLNAYFVVEASQLGDENLRALNQALGAKPSFKAFTDTNFVFSLLGLHDDEQNEAAKALLTLAKEIGDKVTVEFFIVPPTVDEARAALDVEIGQLGDLRFTPNLASAALDAPHLPNGARVLASASLRAGRPVSAKDFLTPFLTNTVRLLRERGVELYNANFATYENNPAVLSDVKKQRNIAEDENKKKKAKSKTKAKTEAQIKHDTMLWHFVRDKRPKRIDSPLEAGFWVLTEDFRFLGFDSFKGSGQPGYIGACIHPLTFLQMLQFWVPRNAELEAALISNLRLALRDFDRQAEQVTVRILQNLSQYEDAHFLPQDTVTSVLMNQVVRQKMRTSQTVDRDQALIRDALLEEHNRVAEEHRKAVADLSRVEGEKHASESAVTTLRDRVRVLEGEKEAAERTLQTLAQKTQAEDVARDLAKKAKSDVQRFVERWLVIPSGLVAIVTGVVALLGSYFHLWDWRMNAVVLLSGLAIWPVVIDKAGVRSEAVATTPAFQHFRQARKWLYAVLGALFIATISQTVANLLSKMAEDRMQPQTAPPKASDKAPPVRR